MTIINIQRASRAGTVITTQAATATDTFVAEPDGVLDVVNGGGAPTTITFATPGSDKYGSARPEVTVTVAAGARKRIGFGDRGVGFPDDLVDPADDLVHISTSPTTSVTFAYTD